MNNNTETKVSKTPQIVVNVSKKAKEQISILKKRFNASDKEFIDAVLNIINSTPDEVIQAAVETVTIEKQVAKVKARIAKLTEKIAQEEATLVETNTELPTSEVDTSEEEDAAEEGHD